MPGNHSEVSLNEQNGIDNDNKKTKKKKKKKDVTVVDDNEFDSTNQLVMPSNSKSKNRFLAKIRKKPKSPKRCSSSCSSSSSSTTRSGSRKGGCFRLIRPRRSERDGDGGDDTVASPVSDPNDERFSHEMLRVMLETNDFCSDECNPHR